MATMGNDSDGFWKRWWYEAEPLAIHGLSVLMIELMILAVGFGVKKLSVIFPERESWFRLLEEIDVRLMIALGAMFGAYCFLVILIRLFRGLKKEWGAPPSAASLAK